MVNDGPAVGAMWQGEYLLQAALGDPAHGVFRAQRRRDSSSVALRLWRAPNDALAGQFLEHAGSACSVHHAALAQVEACGREEQFCFVVSEYVVGQKLDTWADQVGIPPLGEVVELMRRVCDGLQLAARSGVLHSALHPRNVVMLQAESAANRRQQPKLLDLGVPSFARPRQPHALAAQFMAPELLTCVIEPGEPALPATTAAMNVYSCGALLYYLCTGGPPFRQSELSALHEAQLQGRLVLPSRINPQITASLNAVIVQALSVDPKQRFASVADLTEALSRVTLSTSVANARPVLTVPPPRSSSVPPQPPLAAGSRASAVGLRRISPPPAISVPPGISRRPPMAADEFEPEHETARTGRIPTVRPPVAWEADADTMPPPGEATGAPAGLFSSVPPARISSKPPQAVLATPLALFTGSPNTQTQEPPPSKPPALHQDTPSLLGTQERSPSPPLPDFRPRSPLMWLGAGAAALCAGLFVLVRVFGSVAPESAEQTPTVTVERPATDPGPSARVVAPEPPRAPAPPPAVPAATPPPASEPEPEPFAARESPSAARSGRRSARSNSTGAVIASRDTRSSGAPGAQSRDNAPDAAAAREPSPTSVVEVVPQHAEPMPSIELLPAPVKVPNHNGETAPGIAVRPTEPTVIAAAPRPEVQSRPLEAKPAIGDVTIRGSLPTSWVRRAVDRIRPQLAACYARAAQSAGRNQFGTLTVELEIDERGRARSPSARGSSLSGLNDCVAEAAGKVICERAPDTGTVHASIKVSFTP